MRFDKLIWIPLTLHLLNCGGTENKLFWIDKGEQHENDFLFLAESTNIEKLKADSLNLFLSKDELANYDSGTTYKNFGQIYKGDKFKVFVLLRSIDTQGRDYTFLIRTFDNDWKLIDDFALGTWDETKGKYCIGSINKDLIIERRCEDKGISDIIQITDEGKIVMTSFHKP
jgi:hypothetical protein